MPIKEMTPKSPTLIDGPELWQGTHVRYRPIIKRRFLSKDLSMFVCYAEKCPGVPGHCVAAKHVRVDEERNFGETTQGQPLVDTQVLAVVLNPECRP